MRQNTGIICFTLLGLSMGCTEPQAQLPGNSKPSVSPALTPTGSGSPPKPSATPIPSSQPSVIQITNGFECANDDLPQTKPVLKYPIDLTVSPDGSDIYIVSKRCDEYDTIRPNLDHEPFNFTDCSSSSSSTLLHKQAIYHWNKNTPQLTILDINNPDLSCDLGEDIEMDTHNRLYLDTFYTHRVERLDLQNKQAEQLLQINEMQSTYDLPALGPDGYPKRNPNLAGPANLYVDGDELYFAMRGLTPNAETEVRQYLGNNMTKTIFLDHNSYNNGQILYTDYGVYQNQVYLGGTSLLKPKSADSTAYETVPVDFSSEYTVKSVMYIEIKSNSKGDFYFTDTINHILGKIHFNSTRNKVVMTIFAGNLTSGLKDGKGTAAQFNFPMGLVIDSNDNLYVADMGNNAIRKITPDGNVSTVYVEKNQ